MSSKKSFVIRIDEDTFKVLEKWASDEFRSVNGQIEWIIDKALKDAKRKRLLPNPLPKSGGSQRD